MPRKKRSNPKDKNTEYPTTEIYRESAVWNCENLNTGFSTRINGVLAQVLKKYPDDYRLTFVTAHS